jgi:Zn-dependent metalloprotease
MKHFFLSLALISASSSFAITYKGDAAARMIAGADIVSIDDNRHTLSFVHFVQTPVSGDHVAWLRGILKTGAETGFEFYKSETDQLGWTHFRYYQLYKGVRVENAVFYIHVKDGKILSANGEFYSGIDTRVQPVIPASTAGATAIAELHSTKLETQHPMDETKLVVFRTKNDQYHLAWKVDAWSATPMLRYYFFIDAKSGKVLEKISRICEIDVPAFGFTGFNGAQPFTTDSISASSYRLFETGRNIHTHSPGPVDFFDSDNYWSSTANLDNYALDAHWGAEVTHDFYLGLGLNGQDGNGMLAEMQVHDGPYVNAFWNGTYCAFGDGDAQYYPLTSLDVVAHEYTHGVTEFSAALVYAGESGALNESFSDVFGNTMRFIFNPSGATWFVGDQICIPLTGSQPFRNMSNPNQFQCADTYGGTWWNNGDIVHYDSGVQNYWYYLLCMGGSGTNDIGNNFNVTGIGMTDAITITFRNLTTYLTPNSTFADARMYAEQSAEDLFGACSNQVIQTANAWYAVGVGTPFTGAVQANFTASPSVSCSAPATVSFLNTSYNGTSYYWDFGDGNNSTAASPTHTYLNPGTYNVSLIVNGTGNCIGSDTIVVTGAVTVYNNPGPVPATCIPSTLNYCCNHGITNVTFNSINWNSPDAIDGYSDFTCADSTLLIAGNFYPVSITTTGMATSGFDESVAVFIDYDNDGTFNNTNEYVFYDGPNSTGVHTGNIYTSASATVNTRLRMRVISDNDSILNGCYQPQVGQVEDYMLYFVPNSLPPIANFTANMTVVPVGGFVNFNDLSQNAPTSWNWTFTSGSPATSPIQNPVNIQYNTVGVYPVTLAATNGFGSDTLTQTLYISVVNSANICQSTTMTSGNGTLYDSGGPNGNYIDNESCTFLIDPNPCVSNLTLSFLQFDLESFYDYFTVYDGTNASAPLIGSYTGNTLPPTLTSTSGKFFIQFTSDVSIVYSGFQVTWSSTALTNGPAASFSYAPVSPPANTPVTFTDQSLNAPTSWSWSFGDNTYSSLQNPVHTYTMSGTYTVTLVASNCIDSDTTEFLLNVLPVGISESSMENGFSVYPNPFSASTTVHLSESFDAAATRIEICDITGRVVRTVYPESNTVTIEKLTLNSGMYFLNVYSEGQMIGTKRIIISE